MSFVIGQSVYYGFGFSTQNRNCSILNSNCTKTVFIFFEIHHDEHLTQITLLSAVI